MDRERFLLDRFHCVGEGLHRIKVSRWKQLPYLLAEMECLVGVEIGTEKGQFADTLLNKIPGLKLTVVDCWEAYPEYRETMQPRIDEYERKCRERLGDRCKIIKAYSLDAVKQFDNNSLDFVYIDANHEFRQVIDDIDEWARRVKNGGLVMGHDFALVDNGYERIDVDPAVRAWCAAKGIKHWFVTDEGDRMPSWLYVRE